MPAPQEFLAYVEQHTDDFVDRLAKAVAIPVRTGTLISQGRTVCELAIGSGTMRPRAHAFLAASSTVRLRRCCLQVSRQSS